MMRQCYVTFAVFFLTTSLTAAPFTTPFDTIPDFAANPTHRSVKAGNWSDPTVWDAGTVPGNGAIVQVLHNVVYDLESTARISTVSPRGGGNLSFAPTLRTRLFVANLLVAPDGFLTIGTPSAPVQWQPTAMLRVGCEIVITNTPTDAVTDPNQYGTGIIGLGRVTMCGMDTTERVRLAVIPQAGHTTLQFQTPVSGWQGVERVIVPDSRQLRGSEKGTGYQNRTELCRVTSVAADGLSVTLQDPIQYTHPDDGSGDAEYMPLVQNLSRSVLIRSETTAAGATRHHCLFSSRAEMYVRNVTFHGGGRFTHTGGTSQKPRFPVYLRHLWGPLPSTGDYQYTIQGCAILDTGEPGFQSPYRWGLTIEDSHFGLIKSNCIFNWAGAGIMLAQGNESYNEIDGNTVMQINGTGQRADTAQGSQGIGLWLPSGNNYVRGNVCAAIGRGQSPHFHAGWQLFCNRRSVQIPDFAGADTTDTSQTSTYDCAAGQVLEFDGNECFSAGEGAGYWYLNALPTQALGGMPSTLRNVKIWNCYNVGVFAYYSSRLTIDGLAIRNNVAWAASEPALGFSNEDYFADQLLLKNVDIRGCKYGLKMSTVRNRSTNTVQDGYLKNRINVLHQSPWQNGDNADTFAAYMGGTTVLRNLVSGGAVPGAPLKDIEMMYSGGDNLTCLNAIQVYDWGGVIGDSFQVYFNEQSPTFVVPQDLWNAGHTYRRAIGSPVAGLTNQQNWDTYGLAIAGAVLPSGTVMRTGINGPVKALP